MNLLTNPTRIFVTKSKAGHYRATVREYIGWGSCVIFKSEPRSTKDAAMHEARSFLAEAA